MSKARAMSRGTATDPGSWVDQHGDGLYRYALLRVQDPELAADLVQETFLDALRNRESFRGEASERTWLVGILNRRISDHFRQVYRSRPALEDREGSKVSEGVFNELGQWRVRPAAWNGDPERDMERVEFWETLRGCLARLPPTLADTFVQREVEGFSGTEVCENCQISPANLWARLYRARLLLRECLERRWFGPR